MKTIITLLTVCGIATACYADIQAPPQSQYGPTRKLGRALANILHGGTEIPVTIAEVNDAEGNAAAATYGVVKGVGRSLFRLNRGVFELITWPFPTYKGTYRPPYPDEVPWIHGGYQEFPPELGWESKYDYIRK